MGTATALPSPLHPPARDMADTATQHAQFATEVGVVAFMEGMDIVERLLSDAPYNEGLQEASALLRYAAMQLEVGPPLRQLCTPPSVN